LDFLSSDSFISRDFSPVLTGMFFLSSASLSFSGRLIIAFLKICVHVQAIIRSLSRRLILSFWFELSQKRYSISKTDPEGLGQNSSWDLSLSLPHFLVAGGVARIRLLGPIFMAPLFLDGMGRRPRERPL